MWNDSVCLKGGPGVSSYISWGKLWRFVICKHQIIKLKRYSRLFNLFGFYEQGGENQQHAVEIMLAFKKTFILHYIKVDYMVIKSFSTKRYRLHRCSYHLHYLICPPCTFPCCALYFLLVPSQVVDQTWTCPFCFMQRIAPSNDS